METSQNHLKIFCSGSCRLLTTFANRTNIDAIHTLYGPYFEGTNFMGKFHDTKQHIQFIKYIKGIKDFNSDDITKRILTCYNYTKWTKHGIFEALDTIPQKIINLRSQIDNCDVYIFEICSLKLYNYKGFYCQYEQMPNNDISDYNVIIQDEEDLYKDLGIIKEFFPNKKIIFQCHFRPNIIQRIPGGLAPEVETLDTAEPIGSALAGACERLHRRIIVYNKYLFYF